LGETITEESPLLTNLTQKETRHRKNPGTRMSVNGIRHLVDRLLYDTGLRRTDNKGKTKRYITATCHSLRKFMRSQLHFAGVDHLHAETLVGHSTGLVGVYTKISDDDLLKSYLQAIPNLTINEEERQKQIVKELTAAREKDQLTFQKQFEEMKEKMERYDKLEKQFSELNKRLLGITNKKQLC
jgi:hypothetical protein